MDDASGGHQAADREMIAFRVGPQEFCVDIAEVRELRGWSQTTPLPQAPPSVTGVINLRGTILPVIDMGVRVGLSPCEAGARHVIIVVSIGAQLVGLLVDSVCDILTVAGDALQPTPEVAGETIQTFVTALIAADDRMIGVLALDQLLPAMAQAA